jgi:lipid intermediate transporter
VCLCISSLHVHPTETVAFHTGVMLSCYITLNLLDRVHSWRQQHSTPKSGIQQEFRCATQPLNDRATKLTFTMHDASFTLIPLTLLYSSMSKLFLLFLLSIWQPARSQPSNVDKGWSPGQTDNHFISSVLSVLDDDKLDREWIVRNVLGGMSAGFGLRGTSEWPKFCSRLRSGAWGSDI